MSEIRDKIIKLLEESKISFMEDDDVYDAGDWKYKEGDVVVDEKGNKWTIKIIRFLGLRDDDVVLSIDSPVLGHIEKTEPRLRFEHHYTPIENNVSEGIESQPDLFDGEDTYYKDGRQALNFTDVLEAMSEIAPDLDYTGDKQTKDLYWMIYDTSTGSIDSNKVADIESKLAERFGEDVVTVKLANSQYAPEIKRLYIGFVDKADVEDDGIEEAADLLKKGQRVRIKDTAENFPGEEGVIIAIKSTAVSGTPFYSVKLDSGEPYDAVADQVEPAGLEEGWKDNLKKGVATLGVAGALAGNAMAHDPMYDGATRPFDDTNMTVQQVQQLSDEDEKATRLPDGMIQDQYGNKWTQEDWDKLMRGEDPFDDNDNVHEGVNEAVESPAVKEVKKRLSDEFVDLEVVGPTYDAYDPDEPRAGKAQYYIKVPEEFYEAKDLERMLQEIDGKYPDFEYEGEDFSNRFWFVINK